MPFLKRALILSLLKQGTIFQNRPSSLKTQEHCFSSLPFFSVRHLCHSQKQSAHSAVDVTAQMIPCWLGGWLGCNFPTEYLPCNSHETYTVFNQLTQVWAQLIQQLVHSSNWMGHGKFYHFYQYFFFFSKIILIMTFCFEVDHTHPMCDKMFLLSAMLWERNWGTLKLPGRSSPHQKVSSPSAVLRVKL